MGGAAGIGILASSLLPMSAAAAVLIFKVLTVAQIMEEREQGYIFIGSRHVRASSCRRPSFPHLGGFADSGFTTLSHIESCIFVLRYKAEMQLSSFQTSTIYCHLSIQGA